jgi:hypothetical protein
MIEVLGEHYFIDLDKVEGYLDMSDQNSENGFSGETEVKINMLKFEMVKMLFDTVLTEHIEIDDKILNSSTKSGNVTSIPFRIAFNSLLNKKLINHY